MKTNQKLACAIAAILSGTAVTTWAAKETTPSTGLKEITVTAQRRSESIQDVPITIQAIAGESLGQLCA